MLLYIHIPFCDSKCFYCSFNSFTDKKNLKDNYFKALIKELKYELTKLNRLKNYKIETIFIGGGTPSSIEIKYFEKLFKELNIEKNRNIEITTEANPNSASYEWIKEMSNLGVNRFSFGVQSFNKDKLKFLGRRHSPKEAIKAVENAHKIGVKNISIDLIYNTSIDSKKLLIDDLNLANNLAINHISAYSLTIENGSKFEGDFSKSKDDELLSKFFIEETIKRGFFQYEISNFSKNYKSKHNLGYWEYKNYIGTGAGAVGFIDNKRFYPPKDINEYIKNPLNKRVEELSSEDIKMEKLFLGLRSIVGVDINMFNTKELKRVKILIDGNKLILEKDRVFNKNYLLTDEVTLFIIK